MKESNFISAVVYVHNNQDTVGAFLACLHDLLQEHFQKFELICVNDASTDGSVEAIRTFAARAEGAMVSILNMSYYQGLEASMNAGVDLSIGDFVFEFDSAAMDYPPELIWEVYRTALTGFDIVSASAAGGSRLTSRLFYWVFNRFAHTQYQLETESFRLLSRRAINRVHAMSRTIPYRKALYANCGLKMERLRYDPVGGGGRPRAEGGRSRLATDALVLFTNVAYRLALWLAVVMMALTLIVTGYTVVIYLSGSPVEGWTTTMLFLGFGFFGMFAILTLVLKYLSLLVELTFRRQRYVFESIEKISK